jgi:hypothetical protein
MSRERDPDVDEDQESDDSWEAEEPWDSLTLSKAALSVMGAGVVVAAVVAFVWLITLLK